MRKPEAECRGRGPRPARTGAAANQGLRTGTWVLILGAIFLLLTVLTALQYRGGQAVRTAELWVDGVLTKTIDLSEDGTYRIESAEGWNILTVSGGKVAVTAASCPDADCVRCGPQNSGPPIVCLPNRVSIQFSDNGGVDGVAR